MEEALENPGNLKALKRYEPLVTNRYILVSDFTDTV